MANNKLTEAIERAKRRTDLWAPKGECYPDRGRGERDMNCGFLCSACGAELEDSRPPADDWRVAIGSKEPLCPTCQEKVKLTPWHQHICELCGKEFDCTGGKHYDYTDGPEPICPECEAKP